MFLLRKPEQSSIFNKHICAKSAIILRHKLLNSLSRFHDGTLRGKINLVLQGGKTVAIKKMTVTSRSQLQIVRELCALRNLHHPKVSSDVYVACFRLGKLAGWLECETTRDGMDFFL